MEVVIPLVLVDVRKHPQNPPQIERAVLVSDLVELLGEIKAEHGRFIPFEGDQVIEYVLEAIQESEPPRARQAAG